ncbi:DUF3187 family protein [Haliea sp. E17]|uniref:DUF3187 family protein n=1 Tax=Haliea sp. E17 TaxID=3401576 RepID=UPI003AB0B5F5
MNGRARVLLVTLGCMACPLAAEPLYVRDLGPVSGLFGLPVQRAALVLPEGQLELGLFGAIASHYIDDGHGGERLHLDGETDRLALTLQYGFYRDWDLRLELPWLRHSGGFLDSSIDGWHDFWGMSDGGRSVAPRDELLYGYQGQGGFLLEDDAAGPGDPTLSVSRQLIAGENLGALLSLGYKFSLADDDEFLGSGSDDIYLAVQVDGVLGSAGMLHWYGQGGYLYAGNSAMIERIQQRDLWFAGLGLEWRLAPAWALLGQLDSHAAVADSEIPALGDDSVMLSGGVRWRPAPDWALEFSVVEDIRVETAPDVTFQLGLRYRPGGAAGGSSRD